MKEKWVQINKIQGFEEIKDCYWISNSDEDKIINKNTGKIKKIRLNNNGYLVTNLQSRNNKIKPYYLHVIKAKAFIIGSNLSGANMIRHLNDIKTDNRLENLAFGTRSDNTKDSIRNGTFNYEAAAKAAAKGRIINAKKTSKPVRCIETGIIYLSAYEIEHKLGISNANISYCCHGKRQTAGGFHWEFVDKGGK